VLEILIEGKTAAGKQVNLNEDSDALF